MVAMSPLSGCCEAQGVLRVLLPCLQLKNILSFLSGGCSSSVGSGMLCRAHQLQAQQAPLDCWGLVRGSPLQSPLCQLVQLCSASLVLLAAGITVSS